MKQVKRCVRCGTKANTQDAPKSGVALNSEGVCFACHCANNGNPIKDEE